MDTVSSSGGGETTVGGLDPADLLLALPDAVAVVGPDGLVTWANDRAASLLGTDVATMVGSGAFGRIHPDELGRAADGIAWAAAFPERTAVVPYRLQRDDGTYVTVELKSTVVPGPGGDHLVLVLRDGSTRTTLAQALGAVAEGRPVRETARWLARAVAQRWPYTVAAVVHDEDGTWVVTGDDLPDGLADALVAPSAPDPVGVESPWERARATGAPVVAGLDELPPGLAAAAAAHGCAACAVVPVTDPGGRPAVVVAWFDEPMAARLEWAHWASELGELLSLALERRAHQRALFDAARRDPLTGLANRLGFVEQASQVLDDGHDLGLVYVDLDGFKPINDAHGHLVGDQVLASIAGRLAAAVPADAVVARIGGDEFAAALAVPDDDEGGAALAELAERLLAVVAEPIVLGAGGASQRVTLGASAGLAVRRQADHDRDQGTVDAALLLEEADSAMYRAKRAGRGAWRWASTGA